MSNQQAKASFQPRIGLRKFVPYCFSILALLLLHSIKLYAFDAATIYKQTSPSIVIVAAYNLVDDAVSFGTGFFILDGYTIATNAHVIGHAHNIAIKLSDGDFHKAYVVAKDKTRDLALLRADIYAAPLRLAQREPDVGEEIVAIGNPNGLERTISTGIISGIRDTEKNRYYQITAPISPGSSGGPVISARGEVLGVSTFQFTEGQNLNFAMPVGYLHELIAKAAPKAPSAAAAKSAPAPAPSAPAAAVAPATPAAPAKPAAQAHAAPTRDLLGVAEIDGPSDGLRGRYATLPQAPRLGGGKGYAYWGRQNTTVEGVPFEAFFYLDQATGTLGKLTLTFSAMRNSEASDRRCDALWKGYRPVLERLLATFGKTEILTLHHETTNVEHLAKWDFDDLSISMRYLNSAESYARSYPDEERRHSLNCSFDIDFQRK